MEILHKNSAPVQVMAPEESWALDPLGDLICSLLLVSGDRLTLLWSSLKGHIMAVLGLKIEKARERSRPLPFRINVPSPRSTYCV